jgi:diaminopropionate ammonia-lyase
MINWIENPLRDRARVQPESDPTAVQDFHRSLPGYAPTPLIDASQLATEWGVDRVLLKFERERFGLPAFKFLGASWAAHRLLGDPPYDPALTLVAATDGNHGRAVARVAKLADIQATILVPAGTAQARIGAIASEGAEVQVVDGSYDDAVRQSAAMADDTHLLLSDTSWPGYEDVPRWVIEGYATIFAEVEESVDVAVIPIGVGALAAAAARHYRDQPDTKLAAVEPTGAACLLESIRAGEITEVPGPHTSIMAGLNAGLPSLVAWPDVSAAFDVFSAVDDEAAIEGMRTLANLQIEAGEVSGGAVGATRLLIERGAIEPTGTVLILLTEGVTDPANWARLVGGRSAT